MATTVETDPACEGDGTAFGYQIVDWVTNGAFEDTTAPSLTLEQDIVAANQL